MRIDSHQHFWRYDPDEFDWIDDSMASIRRGFLPDDLRVEIAPLGFDGSVAVQARQSLEETEWLLELAAEDALILGVVGWVPLTAPDAADILTQFASNPHLKGVRHVLQGEPDDAYMLRPDFNAGVARLNELGLTYDILIFERHLPQTLAFVDRHPDQVFIVDHIAKPRIRDGVLEPWRANLRRLSERPNVFCKLSGLVTEADPAAWTEAQLLPYMDGALEAFGPERLMFGSDWPVCLAAGTYGRWHDVAVSYASRLSASERAAIFGGTAANAYRLI